MLSSPKPPFLKGTKITTNPQSSMEICSDSLTWKKLGQTWAGHAGQTVQNLSLMRSGTGTGTRTCGSRPGAWAGDACYCCTASWFLCLLCDMLSFMSALFGFLSHGFVVPWHPKSWKQIIFREERRVQKDFASRFSDFISHLVVDAVVLTARLTVVLGKGLVLVLLIWNLLTAFSKSVRSCM